MVRGAWQARANGIPRRGGRDGLDLAMMERLRLQALTLKALP
jgi:hypothetical protein